MSNQFSDYGQLESGSLSREEALTKAGRDTTFLNLCSWAERLENWGKALFILVLVYGIYAAITSAKAVEEVSKYSSKQSGQGVLLFFVTACTYVFYALLEYLLFHTFALLVSALSRIVYNTKVSAIAGIMSVQSSAPANANKGSGSTTNNSGVKNNWPSEEPQPIKYCRRCRTAMVDGECPNCGSWK